MSHPDRLLVGPKSEVGYRKSHHDLNKVLDFVMSSGVHHDGTPYGPTYRHRAAAYRHCVHVDRGLTYARKQFNRANRRHGKAIVKLEVELMRQAQLEEEQANDELEAATRWCSDWGYAYWD